MMSRKTLSLMAGAALLAGGGAAIAASSADIVAARQANFKTMGHAMKTSFDELKQASPSIDVLRAQAAALAGAAPKVAGGFPAGSGPESGVKTGALPVIWQKSGDFHAAADKLVKAVGAYQQATASGDVGAAKGALMQVGGACKDCHETFRAKDS